MHFALNSPYTQRAPIVSETIQATNIVRWN